MDLQKSERLRQTGSGNTSQQILQVLQVSADLQHLFSLPRASSLRFAVVATAIKASLEQASIIAGSGWPSLAGLAISASWRHYALVIGH